MATRKETAEILDKRTDFSCYCLSVNELREYRYISERDYEVGQKNSIALRMMVLSAFNELISA